MVLTSRKMFVQFHGSCSLVFSLAVMYVTQSRCSYKAVSGPRFCESLITKSRTRLVYKLGTYSVSKFKKSTEMSPARKEKRQLLRLTNSRTYHSPPFYEK